MSTRIHPFLVILLAALLLLPGAAAAWELRLTNDDFDQQYPAISGTKVVWQDDRNGDWDIYLYDAATGQTRRLTDDPKDQERPQIAGHYVVWEDYRNSQLRENPDIYMLDLETGVEMMVNSPDSLWGGYELRPAIDDTNGVVVVWYESANGISECGRTFYRYIDGSGGPIQAYQDSITQTSPWVSEQKIVWTDTDLGGVYFRYVISQYTPTIVLERMSNDTVTGLRISGDRIVWSQYIPEGMIYNIRLCEMYPTMENGTKSWLSPHESFQTEPAIDGDLVVWNDDRNGNADLYLYDLQAKEERPLVVGSGRQSRPAIDGELVAFTDDRDGNEIHLVSVSSATPLPGVVTVPGGAGTPGDVNGDGTCEDVNGNGRADFADVVLYFNQLSWITANEPVLRFDYNGNGRIDFADVTRLFNSL